MASLVKVEETMMSDDPIVAQKGPYQVTLEVGKPYFWCTCGRSVKQPFCDGSHKGTTFLPQKFNAETAGTFNLCGCKASDDKPFCDGSHNML
jgi:CDGSH iron-sulfur domain-containing protein 3